MSITVSDCLRLPSLRDCKVLAGRAGLSHMVSSVSVLEIFDETLFEQADPVNTNEITLTSFSAIQDDPALQCRYLEHLYQSGDSAVILYYVGLYLPAVDPLLIETADRLQLPLLVTPERRVDFLYRDALREIYEAIFREETRERDLLDRILPLVSRLPEEHKRLPHLLRLISDSLKCTLLLTDAGVNNLTLAKWPNSNDITAEEICGLLDGNRPTAAYDMQAVLRGREMHIFHVPFTTFAYRNFSLYAIDELGTLTRSDMYDVQELMQILSQLWELDGDHILENALIPAILDGDAARMHKLASALPIDISIFNTMLILRPRDERQSARARFQMQHAMLRRIKEWATALHRPCVADAYGALIVGLIPYQAADDADQACLHDLLLQLDQIRSDYTLAYFPCDDDAEHVQKTYTFYGESIEAATRIFPTRRLFSYGDLVFARQCSQHCAAKDETYQICSNILRPILREPDAAVLLETLAVYYLDADCEVKTAAARLFVHRNTIQYRLAKIRAVTNFQTSDSLAAALLHQAIACYRLETR